MVRCWCVHVYTWYLAGVSCAGWGGVGWGCIHVSGSCTHAGCYAAATLVFMCTHGTLLVCHVQRCYSSRIDRDNCCQCETSGGKDIPPIRNRMHQVKLHQTACMANRVKWIRCKLQVIVDFSARFGEKN